MKTAWNMNFAISLYGENVYKLPEIRQKPEHSHACSIDIVVCMYVMHVDWVAVRSDRLPSKNKHVLKYSYVYVCIFVLGGMYSDEIIVQKNPTKPTKLTEIKVDHNKKLIDL